MHRQAIAGFALTLVTVLGSFVARHRLVAAGHAAVTYVRHARP